MPLGGSSHNVDLQHLCVTRWELMSKPPGEAGPEPAHVVHFLHSRVIGWERAHVMCSGGIGAHNAHFLNSRVIGVELMSCAVEPGVETTR